MTLATNRDSVLIIILPKQAPEVKTIRIAMQCIIICTVSYSSQEENYYNVMQLPCLCSIIYFLHYIIEIAYPGKTLRRSLATMRVCGVEFPRNEGWQRECIGGQTVLRQWHISYLCNGLIFRPTKDVIS